VVDETGEEGDRPCRLRGRPRRRARRTTTPPATAASPCTPGSSPSRRRRRRARTGIEGWTAPEEWRSLSLWALATREQCMTGWWRGDGRRMVIRPSAAVYLCECGSYAREQRERAKMRRRESKSDTTVFKNSCGANKFGGCLSCDF
jgi:hypothetical protein